jgi:DNA-binding beta-propeller fold protein YncE
MLSADGTRIVAGGNTVDVFNINIKNKFTYSSSDTSAAPTHNNLVIMKSAGNTTITATQTTATGSATITSDLTILNTGVVSTGTLTLKSRFGGYGNDNPGFYLPSGVAIDVSGNMVIVDGLNARVKVHNMANNAFILKFGSNGVSDGQLRVSAGQTPRGVATFMSGNIVVSDTQSDRMQVFDRTGAFIRKFGSAGTDAGQLSGPRGVAIDHRNKNIIVTDTGNNRIQVFSETGTSIRTFGSFGVDDGNLKSPNGVAIDINGNIYVADSGNNRVQVFSETGTFVRKFGSIGSGNGQLNVPSAIAMDAIGKIIVIDYNNTRIQIFNNDGTYVNGFSGNGLNQPGYIAVNASGNIIITNSNANEIIIIG